jgi:TldD protein
MGATFLGAGRLEPQEVIGATRRGLYVHRMEAASVDPASGVAVFRVSDADRIQDGKIDRPVIPFLLLAELKSTLASLDLIASDLAFDQCVGACLKDGQPLAVSVGTPTFRVGIVRVLKEKSLESMM